MAGRDKQAKTTAPVVRILNTGAVSRPQQMELFHLVLRLAGRRIMRAAGTRYEAEAVQITVCQALAITPESVCIEGDFSIPDLVLRTSELIVDFRKAATRASVCSRRIAIEVEVTP